MNKEITQTQAACLLEKCDIPWGRWAAVFPPQYVIATQSIMDELGLEGAMLQEYYMGGGRTENDLEVCQIVLNCKKLENRADVKVEDVNPTAARLKAECERGDTPEGFKAKGV